MRRQAGNRCPGGSAGRTGDADPPELIAGLTPEVPPSTGSRRPGDPRDGGFLPPPVDDRAYGEIAAANALDVFAMGGRVLFAWRSAFPRTPRESPCDLHGASSKVRKAGGTLAGGHTIRDPEPKSGWRWSARRTPTNCSERAAPAPATVLLTGGSVRGIMVTGERQGGLAAADRRPPASRCATLNRAAGEALVCGRDPAASPT